MANGSVDLAPPAFDEASMLARFATGESDPAGLIAFSLHRRALAAFRQDFAIHHGRAPEASEENAFLIGEVSASRLAAYRASADALLKQTGSRMTGTPKRKARWPWFGMWIDAPMAPGGEPEKINWRGLFIRLLVLLLAVITTAILLRILIVKN